MQTNLYLAYGSNLNLAQMRHRCPGARVVGYTFLHDRHPVFRGSGSGNYLTLDEGAPACPLGVPCGVFAITRRDRDALDCYEGYPRFYDRVRVALSIVYSLQTHRVVLQDVTAMVYLMQPGHPLGLPTHSYWQTCRAGYADFGFNLDVLRQALLDSTPR